MKKITGVILIFLFLWVALPSNLSAQTSGNNVPINGDLSVYFSPNSIGDYYFYYNFSNLWPHYVEVSVYWQSDTYPGWKNFYTSRVNQQTVLLHSGTNDNVRYMAIFRTTDINATVSWIFY
ncbi:MAG: hypothetical protein PHN43_01660 [Patescibacteria group bacterium]|jgi:hypothetical protein|nr:hypothetical protein [Patescibacteria group bacterium]MDD3435461.1 hypothetical protein [Patescibacteria group bacterium]